MNIDDKNKLMKALGEAADEFFADEVKELSDERDAIQNMLKGLKDNLSLLHGLVVPQEDGETEVVAEEAVAEEVTIEEVLSEEPALEEADQVEDVQEEIAPEPAEAVEPQETPESLGLSAPEGDTPTATPVETPESLGLTSEDVPDLEEVTEESVIEAVEETVEEITQDEEAAPTEEVEAREETTDGEEK